MLVTLSALATTRTVARADNRELFGLGPAQPPPAKPSCTDDRTFGCTGSTDELADATPFALSTYLSAAYLRSLPAGYATSDGIAQYGLGGARDEQGVGFAGANGLETRWTVAGAPSDDARYGGADTSIPLAFLRGLRVSSGGWSARDRVSTGGAIDADLLEGTPTHQVDAQVFGSLTGAPRYRAIAPNMYQLRRLYTRAEPAAAATLTATGPLPVAHAWYAAGVAANVTPAQFRRETNGLVDADANQVPDLDAGTPGGFALDHLSTTHQTVADFAVPVLARAGADRGAHHLALSLVGAFAKDHPTLALATEQASGIDRTTTTGDAIADYRLVLPATRLHLQLAWHRSATREAARDAAAATTPQLLSAYVPASLADDPMLAATCAAGLNGNFTPCPIPIGFFASGGAGLLVDQTADRPTATADVTQRLSARHVGRAGFAFEDTRLVIDSRFTGNELDRSLFPGHIDHASFHGTGTCVDMAFRGPCDYLDNSVVNFRTRYTAGYVEDTFRPAPAIAVSFGARYELMWVGTALHFSDELAPRLGATYDFALPENLGTGRAFASLGRSFAYLPAGLGYTVLPRDRIVHDVEIANIGNTRSLDSGAPDTIAQDLRPTTQDEASVGVQAGIAGALHAIAWAQARRLTAMETAGRELTNPSDGASTAERETRTVAAELATAGKLALRVGYTYTMAVGNTTGMADPRQGAVLYAGSDFDTAPTRNQFGALPTQTGHRVYVEGRRTGHLAGVPVGLGARLTASSGRPRDVLGQSGEGIVFLLPRGAGGTGPMLTQANVQLSTRVAGCDVALDVFNLFDHTDATTVEGVYTITGAQPISGGTRADLVFLRGTAGAPVQRWTPFQYGTQFQSPIGATLGIRRTF